MNALEPQMFLIFYRPENLYKKDKMKIYKIKIS